MLEPRQTDKRPALLLVEKLSVKSEE